MDAAPATSARIAGPGLRLVPVGLGIALVPLDTAVNIAFPDITRHFGLAIPQIQWIVILYMLTHAALMLAFGRAGDFWSHGRVFRAGLLWSAAAFAGCALAPSYGWLLLARILQGIGAGLVISCGPALVTGLYPEAQRGRAIGAFTLIFALASAAGPLLGGVLVQRWGWPAVFWFRVPIALVAALTFRDKVPIDGARPVRSPGSGGLDLIGALLLACTLSTLLLTLDQLQHLRERGLLILPLGALAGGGLVAFLRWEARASHPIIRLELFRDRGFSGINLAATAMNLTNFAVLLFVPYFLARATVMPLAASGVLLAASFAGMAAASLRAGPLLERVPGRYLAPCGAVASGVGLAWVGLWPAGASAPVIVAALLLQGFGFGLFQVAYMDLVLSALPAAHRGVAGSLAMLTRTVGVAAGASLLTLLFKALGGSAAEPGAFLPAFRTTFVAVGLASLLAGAMLTFLTKPRGHARR